jgi:hypothetical protein
MPSLADFLQPQNPQQSGQKMGAHFINMLSDMATQAGQKLRSSRKLIEESAKEFPKYGPKTQEMASQMAEGYMPVGMFVPAEAKIAFKAAQLERKGIDPKEIFNQVGAFKNPADKQWRQEISDKVASLKGGPDFQSAVFDQMKALGKDVTAEPMKVSDVIHHPELFAKHPELKDIEVQFLPEKHPAYARMGFAEDGNHFLQIKGSLPAEDATKSALHELQHVIQESSGHAVGGSSADFMLQDPAVKARDILNWRKEVESKAERMGLSPSKNSDWYMNAQQALTDDFYNAKAHDFIPTEEIRHQAMQPMYSKGTDARTQAEQLVKLYGLDTKTTPYNPYQMYNRLAGESEARQVMSRKNLTNEERQQYFPGEERTPANPYGMDVPIKDMLYLNREGYPQP